MFKNVIAPTLVATLLAGAAFAAAPVELTDQNKAQIRKNLEDQGYKVGAIKIERGLYEAKASKEGKRLEVILDADFKIVNPNHKD